MIIKNIWIDCQKDIIDHRSVEERTSCKGDWVAKIVLVNKYNEVRDPIWPEAVQISQHSIAEILREEVVLHE